MVLPKTTLQFSRFAGTALKTFTHGYAQTVVAASQSTFNQQTNPTPLSGSFSNRFHTLQSLRSNDVGESSHSATVSNVLGHTPVKTGLIRDVAGLNQNADVWAKVQRRDNTRLAWKPSTAVPTTTDKTQYVIRPLAPLDDAEPNSVSPPSERSALKRSYSTSAVYDFAKGIDNEVAEAVALAQVNEAVTGVLSPRAVGHTPQTSPRLVARRCSESASDSSLPLSLDTTATELNVGGDALAMKPLPSVPTASAREQVHLDHAQQHLKTLVAAVNACSYPHQAVPQALQIYSGLLERKVQPDNAFLDLLVGVLASRALHVARLVQKQRQDSTSHAVPGQMSDLPQADGYVFAQDQSFDLAMSIAKGSSVSTSHLEDLFETCAITGRSHDLRTVCHQIFANPMPPSSRIFPIMIAAYASAGDLDAAVYCYNVYKDLAVANDQGQLVMDRIDNKVYAAVVKAYGDCDRLSAGKRFFGRIHASEPDTAKKDALSDAIWIDAFIPLALQHGTPELLENWKSNVTAAQLERATVAFILKAAELGLVAESTSAYDMLKDTQNDLLEPCTAMLLMHLRNGDVEAAEPYWRAIEAGPVTVAQVAPTVMSATALILADRALQALEQTRHMFARIRSNSRSEGREAESSAFLSTAIHKLTRQVEYSSMETKDAAAAGLLRLMNDNDSLNVVFAGRILAMLGPQSIAQLSHDDLATFTKTQGRLIIDQQAPDVAVMPRFASLLEAIVSRQILPDVSTETMIEKTLEQIASPDLTLLWNNYRYPKPSPPAVTLLSAVVPRIQRYDVGLEHDPYAATIDDRGSVFITDLVDGPRFSAMNLGQALNKLRAIRRHGRHPRYFAYSKLIGAAAKEGRFGDVLEILAAAKHDIPLQPEYRVVRHGWISILDSALAACLTLKRGELAEPYHQQLLALAAAPSANTYGLYIAGLKSTKSSDEASEALAIFSRARAEGVYPTSFLYNALIGKLGKARRIDDCLFHLSEMRNLGIRPTSVTYGTIVNALVRVSDERFAEEMFEEMERADNYKPRPAPYHSLMQHFLTTKGDKAKVLAYYTRMQDRGIAPTSHTYKLLIDTHALSPSDLPAAEAVLADMKAAGHKPEAVHYAALINAKGCVALDLAGATALYDSIPGSSRDSAIYQAQAESLVANNACHRLDGLLADMTTSRTKMTAYVANALIKGYHAAGDIGKAKGVFAQLSWRDREPSTYETMARACLALDDDKKTAREIVREAEQRGYPPAVVAKIRDVVA